MDVRLKTLPFTYGGHRLRLCCNMNVLADLQESGGLEPLLDANRSFRSYIRLLTAMLNEAADEAGIDLHATEREVGRKVRWDPKAERFLDDAAADALRDYPHRDWRKG